ncbi:MAG: SAM-dependent methyltransferase [Pseudonocardiales bacterium]|nr:SAM-dependent methyltransferase [Pseudonocardiales bacterium]
MGGSHHNVADHDLAECILLGAPHLADVVRVYRVFLGRVVRYLVGAGVRQFLDLGSGLPTAGNVHQVAQALNSRCRVVYVDIDPRVVAESHLLLIGDHDATIMHADLRQPQRVLDAIRRDGLLDLSVPVAVLATDVLHHIPDTDHPAEIMAAYMGAVCSGSYLSVAHSGYDEGLIAGLVTVRDFCQVPVPLLTFRCLRQITEFFSGLDLVHPGIVPFPLWHSESGEDLRADPEIFPAYCGLGRKP